MSGHIEGPNHNDRLNKVSENSEAVKRMAGSAVIYNARRTSESRDMSLVLDCRKITACTCLRG